MRKIVLIISIFILSLFLLTACGGGKKKTPTTGFIGGTEGIVADITIDSSSGNNVVYDGGTDIFNVNINLENRGEDTAETGEVIITLSGIPFDAFSIDNPTKRSEIPLLGRRKEAGGVTDPAQAIVQYQANYQPDAEADRPVDLAANFCYLYQTTSLVSDLCLKKRVTGHSGGDTVCTIEGQKIADSSGSSFKITTVSERPIGEQKVNVFIVAENTGQGTIFRPQYMSKGQCISSEEDKNKIKVKVELSDFVAQSSNAIKCSGMTSNEGEVNVIQNKIQLSCDISTSFINQDTAFPTPLSVTFDYVYKDSVSTTLTLKSAV